MVTLIKRMLRHWLTPLWRTHQVFPPRVMRAITEAIRQSETRHRGEIRFVVEASLDFMAVVRNQSARERAIEVFSRLGIWDTEYNNGVLIYLLLADHDVEIIADRGINSHLGQEEWQAICRGMENAFREKRFEEGVIAGIQAVNEHLIRHYPGRNIRTNELPDQPVIL
jgi:uncharacterized membrane protein YgcG